MMVQIFACNTLTGTKKYLSPSALQLLVDQCVFNLNLVLCNDIFSCWCPHIVELQAEQNRVYLRRDSEGYSTRQASMPCLKVLPFK